jgi:hypothetical protein
MKRNRAKIVIKDIEKNSMYCPSCLTKLVANGGFEYEDCCNTPHWSAKWVCPSAGYLDKKAGQFKQCLCHEYKTFWNDEGEFFSGSEYYCNKVKGKPIEFIHGPDAYAAFNTLSKECEVTIYKRNLPRTIYFHPALCLWYLKPGIEFDYTADRLGNVLSRKWHFTFLKKDKLISNHYCIHWVSAYRMIKFCIKQFNRDLKSFRKSPNGKYSIRRMYKHFDAEESYDKRWWKKAVRVYFSLFYPNTKKIVEKKFQNMLRD